MEVSESGTPAAVFIWVDGAAGAAEVHAPDISAEIFLGGNGTEGKFDLSAPEILASESFDLGNIHKFAPFPAGVRKETDRTDGIENQLIKGLAAGGVDEEVKTVLIPGGSGGAFG